MIYPRFIKKGDIIGITATSEGNEKETDFVRLESGKSKLSDLGFNLMETTNVRTCVKGKSSDARTRAKELKELVENPEVSLIVAAKGGDYLVEMLSFCDFDQIRKRPVWVQGYSDTTGLTFTITTNLNIATIYGCNFGDFGMKDWHPSLYQNLEILQGNEIVQESFDLFEDDFYKKETGLEGYRLVQPVEWKLLTDGHDGGRVSKEDGSILKHPEALELCLEGRVLCGCLDVLLNLVGTRFDRTREFIEQYQKDGILWLLESFDLSSEAMVRGLWQLKEAGWFLGATGFVFGRPAMTRTFTDTTYEEAVFMALEDFHVPIILDADLGHRSPQMTVVNGSYGKVCYHSGKGSMQFSFQ